MRCTKSLSLAAISAAFLALLAPAHVCATKHPKYGGTLRFELQATKISLDPRDWEPGSLASAEDAKLAALIYDRLITLDDYGRFQTVLAAEWSHDANSRTWQFRLRPNVRFSDGGSALTPKDVAGALQPLLPTGMQVSSIENGIQIRSARPIPELLEQLASGRYFIYRAPSDGMLLGTGPFVVADNTVLSSAETAPSASKPVHIKLRANEDAWAGGPFLDSIDITLGLPALRQVLDLQVGRADIVDIPPDPVRKARLDNLRVWSSSPATLLALRFDDTQPVAANPRLREALDLALDRDTMANVLLQKQALPAPALLPQWLSGYAFLLGTRMDLDRAIQIRSSLPANVAAGADSLRLRVDATGDLMKLLGERVAVNARQANISIQPIAHPASNTTTISAPALHLFTWHYDSLSPRTELLNLAHYLHSDVSADALPDTSADTEKLFAEERRILNDRRVLPLLLLPDYLGIAPNIRNWSAAPSGEWRLADVWLDSDEHAAPSTEKPQTRNPERGVHP